MSQETQAKETEDHETNSLSVQVITGDFWEEKREEWVNPFLPGKARSKNTGGVYTKSKGADFLGGP